MVKLLFLGPRLFPGGRDERIRDWFRSRKEEHWILRIRVVPGVVFWLEL